MVENIMINKAMTFEDIEKLNYQQINMVSNKYGEDEFNPNDILDLNEDLSESDQDEILKKYRVPNVPIHRNNAMSLDTGSVGSKKYSNKPMDYLQAPGAAPMYSPLQQHNPKRKQPQLMQDMSITPQGMSRPPVYPNQLQMIPTPAIGNQSGVSSRQKSYEMQHMLSPTNANQ